MAFVFNNAWIGRDLANIMQSLSLEGCTRLRMCASANRYAWYYPNEWSILFRFLSSCFTPEDPEFFIFTRICFFSLHSTNLFFFYLNVFGLLPFSNIIFLGLFSFGVFSIPSFQSPSYSLHFPCPIEIHQLIQELFWRTQLTHAQSLTK